MTGQGSGGNVLAAAALCWVLLGWIVHLWSIVDAAHFEPPRRIPNEA